MTTAARSTLALVLSLACCRRESSHQSLATSTSTPSPRSSTASPSPPNALYDVIELDRRVVIFKPTRDDFTVGRAVFSVHCSTPDQVRVNGETPSSTWNYIELARVAKGEFELASLRIEIAKERPGIVCLSLKVWFNEVTNVSDGLYYQNVDDRYALVAFCTSAEGPEWERAKPRFSQNRVGTLKELDEALSKPFEIRLNQRSLAEVRPKSDGGR